MNELYFVKVFPATGDCLIIGVPEHIEEVDLFLSDHLKNVDFWEPLENY